MLRHYLKTAIHHLTVSKLFSVINILGLATGLAASIIIFLFVRSELSYDKHWPGAERLFKLMQLTEGAPEIDLRVSANAASTLLDYFSSDIDQIAVLEKASFSEVSVGGNSFTADIDFVNEAFPGVFPFDVVRGDVKAVFRNPDALALSESAALAWFGTSDIVGETIAVRAFFAEQGRDYNIVGVYRQPKGNSTLNVRVMGGLFDRQARGGHEVYLKLNNGVDPDSLREQLLDYIDLYVDRTDFDIGAEQALSDIFQYRLIGMGELYFNPTYCAAWNAMPCGSLPVVTGFAAIAVLVLLTACVNYIVLALSRAGQRAREVAMRKVSGAVTGQLVVQFLGESFVILMAALVLALALVDIFLPVFQSYIGVQASLAFNIPETYFILFGLLAVVSLVAGLYPSLYLSRFHPAVTLKNHRPSAVSGFSRLHGTLLVFQFSTSIGLLIATLIVFGQLLYTQRLDPGFNPDNLVQIALGRPQNNDRAQALRQEVLSLPNVHRAALTGMNPGENGVVAFDEYQANNFPTVEAQRIPTIPVGFGFFETMEMPLIAGRVFEPGRDRPETVSPAQGAVDQDKGQPGSIILNESAAKLLGFSSMQDALNQTISSGDQETGSGTNPLTVVGIVADSQYRDLQREAGPEVFFLYPDVAFFLMVRISDQGQAVLSELELSWQNVMGDAVFGSSFVADNLAAVFQDEKHQAVLLISFTLLSLLISCLGLFGVTAFTVDRRSKEIGIRKVFGANMRQVVWLFCWQLTKPVLIANVIAWPVALWAMLTWLQRFPYQIDTLLLIPLCVLAGFIALSIAWLTVAGNTVKVATTNPVYALRYE